MSAFRRRASLGLNGPSISTRPSDVVTRPWLEPRCPVSTDTLAVSCLMASPPRPRRHDLGMAIAAGLHPVKHHARDAGHAMHLARGENDGRARTQPNFLRPVVEQAFPLEDVIDLVGVGVAMN